MNLNLIISTIISLKIRYLNIHYLDLTLRFILLVKKYVNINDSMLKINLAVVMQ